MIKILPVDKIREADAYTIENEPVAPIDLMERAAMQCHRWIHQKNPVGKSINVFCGPGNNGGDGLAIARLLSNQGYHCLVFVVRFSDRYSNDFKINFQRLHTIPGMQVIDIGEEDRLPGISSSDLVIDALLGAGLSKPVSGLAARVIEHINASSAVVVAIDMPSGMFARSMPDEGKGAIIRADYTLTFQFPKLSFFFPESEEFIGEWHVLPIGLHPEFVDNVPATHFLTETHDVEALLKNRRRFGHKGNYGHALLIAGSYGKMGAAVLSSSACLRAGAGLLTTHVPRRGYHIMQTALPEAMVSIDEADNCFSGIRETGIIDAIAIGPGLGMEPATATALKLLIQSAGKPLIIDADAINILGENKTWLAFLPPGSILTPHPREFERMTEKADNSMDRNEMQRQFSIRHGVYVILKGAFTCVSTPKGNCYFNPTGNPGMATAGSGDVLTGILLGLLAQGYTPYETCVLGTYLHGLAGNYAAKRHSQEAMIASDITACLGRAFRELHKKAGTTG